jgi:RecA/RadA recombinase
VSKFDLQDIIADVQGLYKKDAKSRDMISLGNKIKEAFAESDGAPIPPTHPLRDLTSLPVVPFNKIIQFAGNPDTGKSTMLLLLLVAAQAAGFIVILWDAEDKCDMVRLRAMGGDPDNIVLVKTNEILQGAEKVRKLIIAIKTKYPDAKILFDWDSVGGSQSRSHAEKELDNEKNAQPGQDAKENAQVMRMLVSLFNKYPDSISVVLANQVYAKIGFMQVGDKESGGKKVEFHSSLIVQLKRVKTLTKVVKGRRMKYGIITRATVSKNHLTPAAMSVHQMDFQVTAADVVALDGVESVGEEGEESDSE